MIETRQRNSRHHATGNQAQVIDFAGPKQEAGFRYGPMPLCLSGAYNSAKTVTECLKTLAISDIYPGYRWFVGRKIWDELKKTTMTSFFKFCSRAAWEPNGRRADSEKILELNNGSSYIWGHLDDPDTLTLVRGLEINGFLLDQAEELYEEIFTALLPRLGRWDKAQVPDSVRMQYEMSTGKPWPWVHEETGQIMPPSYALLTCNPDHELHWIYERFHPESPRHWEKHIPIEKQPRLLADGTFAPVGSLVSYHDLGYKMIELSAYDNKYATRQSLQEMESQDETWKRRFLHGKWGIPEGQIHQVREASLLQPTAAVLSHVMHKCTLHRSFDHGDSAPASCGWWGVDEEGNVIRYREYYKPDTLISEHRRAITKLSEGERYQFNLADPSIFYDTVQNKDRRMSVAQLYRDVNEFDPETAIFWQKGDNDELGTRDRISEYLKLQGTGETWDRPEPPKMAAEHLDIFHQTGEAPRVHPITKELGYWPRLFFVVRTEDYPNGCQESVRQLKSQRRVKIDTINGRPSFSDERDEKIVDHAYDDIRYFMASRPSRFKQPKTATNGKTYASIRKRMLQQSKSRTHRSRVAAAARAYARTA